MAMWDSAYLLQECKDGARRPGVDQAMPDAKWFRFLTAAQVEAYTDLFTSFPDFGYSAPVQLVTLDGGLTYVWPVDADGDRRQPSGHTEVYPTLSAIPDSPLTPGVDFIFERGLIRFPGGRTRNFPNGPWSRFVADPDAAITASANPQLQPKVARLLLVYKALEKAARRPGSGMKPDEYRGLYSEYLQKMFKRFATAWNRQGAQAAGADSERVWWYSGDLGSGGLNT